MKSKILLPILLYVSRTCAQGAKRIGDMKKASSFFLITMLLLSLTWVFLPSEVSAQPTYVDRSNSLPRWSQHQNFAPMYQVRPTDILDGGTPVAYQNLPPVENLIVNPDSPDEWYVEPQPWPEPDMRDFANSDLDDIQSGDFHCSPTAAAMVIQYWATVRGFSAVGKPAGYPVANYIFDISWHMDTNDVNPYIRSGDEKGHFATFLDRVNLGMKSYVGVRTSSYIVTSTTVGWNEAVYENEIENNRPVIINLHSTLTNMGHSVVGIGFDTDNIYIVDPDVGTDYSHYRTDYRTTFNLGRKGGYRTNSFGDIKITDIYDEFDETGMTIFEILTGNPSPYEWGSWCDELWFTKKDDQPDVLSWVVPSQWVPYYEIFGKYNIWSALYSRTEDRYGAPLLINNWPMKEGASVLNPLTSDDASEWQLLSLVYSTLLNVHPYNNGLMPWCVTEFPLMQLWNGTHVETSPDVWEWDPSPEGSPGEVEGLKMTWTLRDDMTWHDGMPVTTADVEFCLDLLINQNNDRYHDIQENIHDVNVVDTYTFEVYNYERLGSGPWPESWRYYMPLNISAIALLAPKHVWEPYIAADDGILWTEDDPDHRSWQGHLWTDAYGYDAPIIDTPSGYVQLTHLVGNGPFIYPYGGWTPGVSMRLVRDGGNTWHYKRILRSDNNFDGAVDVLDLWAPLHAYGTQPGMPKWLDRADMANPAGLIDGRDIEVVYNWWGYCWYPTSTLPW